MGYTIAEKILGRASRAGIPPMIDGFVAVPDAPGLGVTIAPHAEERRPPIQRPVTMREHRDGFVVDQ